MQELISPAAPVARAPVAIESSTRPLRVAHLYSSLGVYGAERWALTLIKYLDRAKVESSVITIGTKPGATAFHQLLKKQDIPAEHLAIPGKLNNAAVRALRELIERNEIDVLHTHGFKSDILGYLAKRSTGIPVISTPHGWSAHEGMRIRIYEAIGRVFMRRLDGVYPVSPALYDDLIARGFAASRVKLIVNGVDIRAFDACFNGRSVRRTGTPFNILFAGRLCKPKGVYDLLQAFAALDMPDARLRFAGAGEELEELKAVAARLGVADRVEFPGAVDGMAAQFEWAHVLVLPSYSEGISRVVMESFAAGVPVIGSDIPGMRVLVEQGRSGLLVPAGDVNAFASALGEVASRPDFGFQMALEARRRIDTHFSAARVAEQYTEEYRRLTAAAAR
jgi:glycosyltransferase involved in cell wall biosynthesis